MRNTRTRNLTGWALLTAAVFVLTGCANQAAVHPIAEDTEDDPVVVVDPAGESVDYELDDTLAAITAADTIFLDGDARGVYTVEYGTGDGPNTVENVEGRWELRTSLGELGLTNIHDLTVTVTPAAGEPATCDITTSTLLLAHNGEPDEETGAVECAFTQGSGYAFMPEPRE